MASNSSATPLSDPSLHDRDRAAAFRAWVQQHGGKATREPQAFMATLPELRARVNAGDALYASAEVHLAGLDLVEAVAQHRLANHAAVAGLADRARAIFDRAARETDNAALAREFHVFSGSCHVQVGNAGYGRALYPEAIRAYGAARERFALLGERKNESMVLRNMGLCYEGCGLLHLAVESMLAAREIAREIDNTFELATHDNALGGLYYELGEDDSSRLCLERALTFFEHDGRGDYHLQTLLQLSRLAVRQHRLDEATALHQRARVVSERIARRELESDRLKEFGVLLRALGRGTEARATLERAAELAVDVGDVDRVADVHHELSRLALSEERLDQARDHAEHARAASTAHGQDGRLLPDILAVIADVAGRQGRWPDAWQAERMRSDALHRAHARAADARARALAVRHQLDLMREEAERRRLDNLRLEEALAKVAARLDAAERAGAKAPDPELIAAEAFRPLGLRPRECEVLLWVARGKSNEEIGVILGCSAETVKSHLKRIYTQLDVTNRTAAAARALGGIRHDVHESAGERPGRAGGR